MGAFFQIYLRAIWYPICKQNFTPFINFSTYHVGIVIHSFDNFPEMSYFCYFYTPANFLPANNIDKLMLNEFSPNLQHYPIRLTCVLFQETALIPIIIICWPFPSVQISDNSERPSFETIALSRSEYSAVSVFSIKGDPSRCRSRTTVTTTRRTRRASRWSSPWPPSSWTSPRTPPTTGLRHRVGTPGKTAGRKSPRVRNWFCVRVTRYCLNWYWAWNVSVFTSPICR